MRQKLGEIAFGLFAFACGAVSFVIAVDWYSPPRIFLDTETGCEYFLARTGNVTPRLHSDGVQVCYQSAQAKIVPVEDMGKNK